ncbi:MAG: S8 family serine peptidase [Planctomycetes bacterium]|nr:S8 family serine peptidase [Planctomycetota bacterium]
MLTTPRRGSRTAFALVAPTLLVGLCSAQEHQPDAPRPQVPVSSFQGVPVTVTEFTVAGDTHFAGAGEFREITTVDPALPLPRPAQVIATDQGDVLVQPKSGNPHFLGFAAGPYFPPAGERLDPGLLAVSTEGSLERHPSGELYAFAMLERRITPELWSEFERLGVRILDFHPWHCLRIATTPERLALLTSHPAVHWVGLPRTWQKVHPYLEQILQASRPRDVLDVIVTVHESDLGPTSQAIPVGEGFATETNAGGSAVLREDSSHALVRWMSHGWQEELLRECGVVIDEYADRPPSFRARVQPHQIDALLALNCVQFVEPLVPDVTHHDESAPMVAADRTRLDYPGSTNAVAIAGIIDSGMESSHLGLNHVNAVGWDLVFSPIEPFNDYCGHGSHVAGTVLGYPTAANLPFTGMAPELGSAGNLRVRIVRIFPGTVYGSCGSATSSHTDRYSPMRNPYTDGGGQTSQPPHVINCSWGSDPGASGWVGTESQCVTLDDEVWDYEQLYVFSAGNAGPTSSSIGRPAVAKNAFAVGNVVDYNATAGPGSLWTGVGGSSQGPAADGRWKPNVVAPGRWIKSVKSDTSNDYIEKYGTSMAAPHVTGVAAQLADHYSWVRYSPHMLAALLMGTSTTKGNVSLTTPTATHLDEYGAGQINAYMAHYTDVDWETHSYRFTQTSGWHYADFTVPTNCTRLIVTMTYHEPAASTGASQALVKDIDLYLDRDPIDPAGNTGEYFAQQSSVDNTEIRHVLSPTPGPWRWKTWPVTTTGSARVAVVVHMITSDQAPTLNVNVAAADQYIQPNEQVDVTATAYPSDFLAPNVFLDLGVTSTGLTLHSSSSLLKDGIATDLLPNQHSGYDVMLGSTNDHSPRVQTWNASWSVEGNKLWSVIGSAENTGSTTSNITITVDGTSPSLVTNLRSTTHATTGWSNDPSITYAWTAATDNLSGIDGYGLFTSLGGPGSPSNVLDIGAVTTYSETLASSSQPYYFNMKSVDRSGNWTSSYANTGPYRIDAVEPGVATGLQTTSHTPGTWSNDSTVDFTWTAATDAHSGVDGYSYGVTTTNPVLPNATKDIEEVTSLTVVFGSSASPRYFNLRAVDNAGNWSSSSANVGPLLIDRTVPTAVGSLSSPTHTAGVWSSATNATVTWTAATDAHSGLQAYGIAWNSSPSTTITSGTQLGAAANSTSTTLAAGTWYFHIAARDRAGNYGPTAHIGPFLIDTTAPLGAPDDRRWRCDDDDDGRHAGSERQ